MERGGEGGADRWGRAMDVVKAVDEGDTLDGVMTKYAQNCHKLDDILI